ncbi:MAG: DUF4846 domain-containing protein [Chitinophagaceae bacterium]|nr:DUF4846 domain-containing protein [Chitinophagaceae bacterium]
MYSQIFFTCLLMLISTAKPSAESSSAIGTIPLPSGYERVYSGANSFASYLRQIKLKKDKTVYLYNGEKKANQSVQYGVLDISTGNKDLQQCADAVMRLRAEYLKQNNQPICFADNAGKNYCWSQYQNRGWQGYLETVFGMCGSLSLEKQLNLKSWSSLQPGDVIIKGGSPGHAVIVVDVARNKNTGDLICMLAQSYMPAQDIHILLNKNKSDISPWYSVPSDYLFTPEWTFQKSQLRTWP